MQHPLFNSSLAQAKERDSYENLGAEGTQK